MGDDKQAITEEQIKQFFAENKDFFVQHPDMLDELNFDVAPQGTISLTQRQTESLRTKVKQLQEQLHALIVNARANEQLQNQVHQLCLDLLDSHDLPTFLDTLLADLKREFNADYVSLTLFYSDAPLTLPETNSTIGQLHADDPQLKEFDHVLSKQKPVCGRLTSSQKAFLFPQHTQQVASIACVPLGHQPCAGILAIASEDTNRFHSDMGTDYLSFLGDVVMRLLRWHGHQ